MMNAVAIDNKQIVEQYVKDLTTQPKTEALVDKYVSDESLKHHIRISEAAFPGYVIEPHALVADGDLVAMRGTFRGTHHGAFAGVEATGKEVSAELLIFYKLVDGRIAEHWMQLDVMALMQQLRD
jgi:predicted ester cyclase